MRQAAASSSLQRRVDEVDNVQRHSYFVMNIQQTIRKIRVQKRYCSLKIVRQFSPQAKYGKTSMNSSVIWMVVHDTCKGLYIPFYYVSPITYRRH